MVLEAFPDAIIFSPIYYESSKPMNRNVLCGGEKQHLETSLEQETTRTSLALRSVGSQPNTSESPSYQGSTGKSEKIRCLERGGRDPLELGGKEPDLQVIVNVPVKLPANITLEEIWKALITMNKAINELTTVVKENMNNVQGMENKIWAVETRMEIISDPGLGNKSRVIEFILQGFGFTVNSGLRMLSFMALLLIYLLTLTGNSLIITLVCTDSHLHTPMYFFLSNLSFMEIWLTTCIVPRMLLDTLSETKSISIAACFTQLYFYFFIGTAEFILLAVMSYDRYLAICRPLHYETIMSGRVCLRLVLICWGGSLLLITFPAIFIMQLSFCGPNIMDHFFCDTAPLMEFACSDTQTLKLVIFILASFILLSPLFITLFTYLSIISTILRMSSSGRSQKAFSTCASHLTVVILSCGSSIFMYVIPHNNSIGLNKMVAVINIIVTPFLSPFLYAIRNEKVKQIMKGTIDKKPRCPAWET
ncbi:olfactory receptor 6M1-like [Rhinatrema bivittatum]|uniref:olfactory receptor 6M1-like n=1 Tax=Rhinatrema bivittatum TaxID=194408 RepID=UPI0011269268|nr:olfactory receptor 6M1-like [Rhinatrema bivittatum]